ncbi:hypothetical protein GF1_21550 [Desulfolithobacter dissulfuricans]|uniref:ABC transporter domain-containing protein n=1 Tax=Desulfolithobacter dissulfuricans TaxID=2795293 RepID=A0A915U1N1_9BACT|nr:ABC transporter ATP-binding protein [Desulfolithobacter dissulfuricans]BCO09779.1 hypothetical protein GF1_21550 [Desulfolithobacter dissulfuricans]
MAAHKETEKRLALRLRNVAVAYERRFGFFRRQKYWALKDVSFDLYHGETLGVIGRNGVGKSTLLRLLAGIIAPDKGEIKNYGVTASLLTLQVGFVPHLTGRENAVLSGMLLGMSKREVLERMDAIREYADIGEFFDHPVREYSTGMRARLGFAVAIHVNPDVILLDEVLGVGDSIFRDKSTKSIKNLIRSQKSVIIVSHQPAMLRELCDRIVWIEKGVVQGIGDVKSVLNTYLQSLKPAVTATSDSQS